MDPADLAQRDREHPVREVVPQVRLGRQRELREVGELPAVLRAQPGSVERPAVVPDIRVSVLERLPQPGQLQLAELTDAHPLGRVQHGCVGYPSRSGVHNAQ